MQSEASTPGERDSKNHHGVGSIELCLPRSDDSVLTVRDMLFSFSVGIPFRFFTSRSKVVSSLGPPSGKEVPDESIWGDT